MALSQILPPRNATTVQRAILDAADQPLPIPLRETLDPLTAPEEWLKWLAQHEAVDLWFDDWSIDRRRQMVAEASELARLVGTRAAAAPFLAYVDAEIIHKVSYPARHPVGRVTAGRRTPIQHKPFVARFLVRTSLTAPPKAIIVGKTSIGRAAVRTINREPLRRAKTALSLSKAPETAYTINFAHRVQRTLDDGLDLAAGAVLGAFRNRVQL